MEQRTCAHDGCAVALPPENRRGPRRKWCPDHRYAYMRNGSALTFSERGSRARQAGIEKKRWEPRDCAECGQAVPLPSLSSWCADDCKRAHVNRRQREWRKRASDELRASVEMQCKECGDVYFAEKSLNQRYCSDGCRAKGRVQDSPSRKCGVDGCDRPHRAKGMCAMHWRRAARAEGRESPSAWGDRRRHNYHARRARLADAATGEPVLFTEIAERDGWLCHICGSPVEPGLGYPDPMSASLDHVVPLALGGSHSPENVALSHLTCNLSKGAKAA